MVNDQPLIKAYFPINKLGDQILINAEKFLKGECFLILLCTVCTRIEKR